MHFGQRKQRLGTCFAALTFSYKGRSLLFCKSIIGCPLSTANFFFFLFRFQINIFIFASSSFVLTAAAERQVDAGVGLVTEG